MKPADRIRRIYERRPYPYGDRRALRRSAWNLDLEWVRTFADLPAGSWPARVLVAGCGDGSEAFALQRLLPGAEVVAVDFSPRSIAVARRLQRRDPGRRRIRFELADLAAPGLARRLGGGFDFISCHGVLSYIPAPVRALRALRRCLAPRGALYLGVNGSAHLSLRLHPALAALGIDPHDYRADRRTEAALQLADAVGAAEGVPAVAQRSAAFLASDIFSDPNHRLALAEWVRLGRAAGLHFRICGSSIRLIRRVIEAGRLPMLMPRSRAEASRLLELLAPGQFHRLVFTRPAEANPPWNDRRRLLRWEVARSGLYQVDFPAPARTVRDRLRPFRVRSGFLRLDIGWRMPEWEVELLRHAAPGRSLGGALAALPLAVPFIEVQRQLYLLHQLGVVTLRPPG